jgi:hypothetical protein
MDEFKRPNRLDSVEETLYSPNANIKKKPRKKLFEEEVGLPEDWTNKVDEEMGVEPIMKENKKGLSIFSKIFIVAFSFFLIALGYAFSVFYFGNNSDGQNVNITISSPVSVAAGEQFSFDVVIENNNSEDMEQIDLAIEYPEGTRSGQDISVNMPRERNDIGSISSGTFQRESRSVYLFGEEGDVKEIEVKIIYRIADSNAVFEKRKVFDVVLKSTPVRMNISSVKEITAGQDLEFDIELVSNANEPLDNILVVAEYPFGFIFNNSTLEPYGSNFVWKIDKLEPKEKLEFTISGEMQGQNSDIKYFKFNSGIENTESPEEIGVLFTSVGKSIEIQRPFLEVDLAIGGDNSSVINLDSDTNYNMQINYKNNTSEIVKDVEVTLKLEGEVLNQFSVQTINGFYDSNSNLITWDKTTNRDFAELRVGQSGQLNVSFRSKPLIGQESFRSPEIILSAKVKGDRIQDDDVPEEIVNEVLKTLRFNTDVDLSINSLYYDGPFENIGSIPPKVGEKTEFSIKLSLLNSSNRISNGVVTMNLPNYVSYENVTWPSGADIKYDTRERQVTWNIGEIREGKGYNNDPVEAAFQVSLVPSLSQTNSEPVLVNNVVFTGTDLFTGEQIKVQGSTITTKITDRRNYFDGQVSQ